MWAFFGHFVAICVLLVAFICLFFEFVANLAAVKQLNYIIMRKIKDLKVGDLFKLKPSGKLYVRSSFCRDIKRYSYYDYDDVNNEHFAKADKLVITDF